MAERFNPTLQENTITILAYSDEHGKVVANLITSDLFEGDYRVIATRILTYWQQFQQAPKVHTADLFDDILSDPHNRKANTFRRILTNMVALSEGMNTEYIIDQVRQFSEVQRIKGAILTSAEQINAKQEHAVEEIKTIWNDLLRSRQVDFDPGLRLSEFDKVLAALAARSDEFKSGIKVLDDRNIVPYRGAMTLILGAAKRGKSWYLIHLGKQALLQRKKVVHITLEMSAEEVAQRYYQSLFAVLKRQAEIELPILQKDKYGELKGFETKIHRPEFAFNSPHIRDELETRILYRGLLFDNLIIKQFPTRSLSMDMLRGYLDNLEVVEKIIPDMLILDYIGITKTDPKNHRISLGRNGEDFRGILGERHMAGVTAAQISKAGAESLQAGSTHVAEDWSLIATADQIIAISNTDAEHQYGLARLFADRVRGEGDRFGALITQSYATGQFCLDSTLLKSEYFAMLKDLIGDADEELSEDDEE